MVLYQPRSSSLLENFLLKIGLPIALPSVRFIYCTMIDTYRSWLAVLRKKYLRYKPLICTQNCPHKDKMIFLSVWNELWHETNEFFFCVFKFFVGSWFESAKCFIQIGIKLIRNLKPYRTALTIKKMYHGVGIQYDPDCAIHWSTSPVICPVLRKHTQVWLSRMTS